VVFSLELFRQNIVNIFHLTNAHHIPHSFHHSGLSYPNDMAFSSACDSLQTALLEEFCRNPQTGRRASARVPLFANTISVHTTKFDAIYSRNWRLRNLRVSGKNIHKRGLASS
jgi:hypothetical protein